MNISIQNFYLHTPPYFYGKKVNITKEQIESLRAQGKKETEIPGILGISPAAYYRNLKKLGISTVHSDFKQKLADIPRDEFEQMLKDKVPIEDICSKYGLTTNAYYLYIERYNLRNYIVGANRKAVTKEQLQTLVDKKLSIEEICKQLGIGESAYYDLLPKLDIATKGRSQRQTIKNITKEQIESLLRSGKNYKEISDQLGISEATLQRLIMDFNIDTKILQTKKIVSTITKERLQELVDSGRPIAEICKELNIPVRTYTRLTHQYGIVTDYRQAKMNIDSITKEELQQLVDAGYTRKEICDMLNLTQESSLYRLLKRFNINYPYQHHNNEIVIPAEDLQAVVDEWKSVRDIQAKLDVSDTTFYQKAKAANVETVLSGPIGKIKSLNLEEIQKALDSGAGIKEICERFDITPNIYDDLVKEYGIVSKTKKKKLEVQSITKEQIESLIKSGKMTKDICKELNISITTYMKLLKKFGIDRTKLLNG